MAFEENKGPEEEKELSELGNESTGRKKFGKMVRMFREGYLSVLIYKNVYEKRTFYDVVVYRKVKSNGVAKYRRGANLKPSDISCLQTLLEEANHYLESIGEIDTPEEETTEDQLSGYIPMTSHRIEEDS